MQRFIQFVRYDNAVPIMLGIIFLGAGGAFAAVNPEVVYSETEKVVSIDNTYIASKNLDAWSPRVTITGVTEDTEHYYVAFTFATISLSDAVWKDVVKEESLTVSKADLGPFRDLGVYVTEQLKQKVGREVATLKETQEYEKKLVTQKVVATTYGGLIGGVLDTTTEVIPGYVPVVIPPTPPEPIYQGGGTIAGAESNSKAFNPASQDPNNTPPRIQILGDNPARVPVGYVYTDLGVVVTDEESHTLTMYLNDALLSGDLHIDTSTTSEYRIRYHAEDAKGLVAFAERTVIVFADDVVSVPENQEQSSTTPAAPNVGTPPTETTEETREETSVSTPVGTEPEPATVPEPATEAAEEQTSESPQPQTPEADSIPAPELESATDAENVPVAETPAAP